MMNIVPGKVSAVSDEEGIWFSPNTDNSWVRVTTVPHGFHCTCFSCIIRKRDLCNYYLGKCFWNQLTDFT
jgi:hypothetical protein